MFSPEQIAALEAPLDRRHVASRSQSGRNLSYIEGWLAIAEANRIFGFDGWNRETLELTAVVERERKIGTAGKDGWGVSYRARVRVTVGDIIREGVGNGHGIDTDLGLAHESAAKEAETDAMKRALMTFGNPFGLALYDKTQANVADAPRPVPANINPGENDPAGEADRAAKWKDWADKNAAKIATFDADALRAWKADNEKFFTKCEKEAPDAYEKLFNAFDDRAMQLMAEQPALAAG
jgi:DNA repair and recombination protein RAD52